MPGGAPAGGGSRQWAGCCCGLRKGALHSARGMWFCKVVACMAADADAVVAPHNSPGLLKDVCAIVTQVLQMLLRLLRCVRPPALCNSSFMLGLSHIFPQLLKVPGHDTATAAFGCSARCCRCLSCSTR